MRDQAASDADQALADRTLVSGGPAGRAAHDADRTERERTTVARLITHESRAATARARAGAASARDAIAAQRDEEASQRDRQAEDLERTLLVSDAPLTQQLEQLRVRAAADRARASEDRAAAARERERLEAELHTAHLDDLTGVFRRKMGWVALTHEIARARRSDGRFVLAFVDVDNLRDINNHAGHAAGDAALRQVVAALRSHLRSFDPIVRYGGDEFVCGLGRAGLADVARRFERIAKDLALRGLGVCVGLAELRPDETLDELAARADAQVLVVKRAHHQRHTGDGEFLWARAARLPLPADGPVLADSNPSASGRLSDD